MRKIAIYGKGGIGKSTTISNLSAALAEQGRTVLQIGCDPKADSTVQLLHGERPATVLELVRSHEEFGLEDMVHVGHGGVLCVEAGGPTPGLGCAGRGIITALETLEQKGAYEVYRPDVVFYDVLGDVVCGGFTMPMRGGYADQVYILTSGEQMSVYAAANIAMAVERFQGRGYAALGGFIVNSRGVPDEAEKAASLASDFNSQVVCTLPHSELVPKAEALGQTVLEAFPQSAMADAYRDLARTLVEGVPC